MVRIKKSLRNKLESRANRKLLCKRVTHKPSNKRHDWFMLSMIVESIKECFAQSVNTKIKMQQNHLYVVKFAHTLQCVTVCNSVCYTVFIIYSNNSNNNSNTQFLNEYRE